MEEFRVAFLGTGDWAQAHVFGLGSLPSYYADAPRIRLSAVGSPTPESRQYFAARYGFAAAVEPDELWRRGDVDALFVLSPNESHCEYLLRAVEGGWVKRIYVEKPLCVDYREEKVLHELARTGAAGRVIQVGYEFLQMGAARRALGLAHRGDLGVPVHFHTRYLHGGYLDEGYRAKRRSRLKPAPAGGAMADLGGHICSFLVAFLGEELEVVAALQSGAFPDVPAESDLCTCVLFRDGRTGAAGTAIASRISAGAGDMLELELRYTRGALRLSSERPDVLEVYSRDAPNEWASVTCSNDYAPVSTFPRLYVPAGWLRPLIHAQYLFLGGQDREALVPDLRHGLAVQRLVRQTAEALADSRRT